MLDFVAFEAAIEDLEKVTTPLTRDQRQIYFEHLRKWPMGHMDKAVKSLIQNYRAKRFPSIPVFRRVLDHVEVEESKPTREELLSVYDSLPCPSCSNIGWWVQDKDGHPTATFCQCKYGVARKTAIEAYFNIRKRIEERHRERSKEAPPDHYYEEEN